MANARIRLALDGVQGVINGLGQVGDRINRVSGSLSTLSVLGIGVGIASLGKFTTELYAAAAAAENLRLTFKFSFGESAGKDLNYVKALANDLGLELASTATAYGKLAAAARGTSLEGDGARAIFESITKASAVMGLSAEQSSGALNALQQMISKGTVASEELRGQLGERLPGAFQIAARAMGVTTQELGKMLEQGQVIADDFLPKFAAQLNSEIGGAAEDAADRLDAATNRMMNSLKRLTTVIAESGIATFFKDLMKSGANDVNAVSEAMERAKNRGSGTLGQLNAGAGMFIGKALALNTFTDEAKTLDQQLASTVKKIADLQAHIESTGKASIYTRSDMASLQKTLAQLTAEQQNRDKANTVNPQDERLKAMGKAREAQITAEKQSTADLAAIRQKLSGVDASYLPTLEKLQALRASGILGEKEYISLVSDLASKNHKKTDSNKAAASAIQKEASAYATLSASIRTKIAESQLELATGTNATESQKIRIKLDQDIAAGRVTMSAAHRTALDIDIEAMALAQQTQKYAEDEAEFYAAQAKAKYDASSAAIKAATDEADSNELLARTFGMTKTAIEQMEIARLKDQLTQAGSIASCTAETVALELQIKARERNAAAMSSVDTKQAGADQSKRLGIDIPGEFGKVEDPFKDFGSTLRATFDSAGDGLQKMSDAMGKLASSGKDYEKEMQVIADLRATKDPGNMATALKNEQKLIEKTKDDQIGAYANMAGAAKSYFDEKSDAYRLLNGLEMAMHAFQMANMAEKLFTSLFVSTASATGVIAGQAAETGAVITGQATQNVAKIPGVFMSFMSSLGPWGAAAAAVAIAAVLGSMGGKSAPSVSMDAFAAQKANTGTGSVLGDPNAQSESLKNSLDALEGYAKPGLTYTSQMVTLLRSIDTSLSGATNSLLQSGFDAFGSDFQGSSKSSGGGIIGSIFGSSSKSTSLSDLGLAFANQTIGAAMQSLELQKFQVTRTDSKKSGFLGFGSSSKTRYSTEMSDVDEKVARSMTLATQQMFALVEKAAGQIGTSQAQIDSLKNINTDLGKVSLKDKTGQEIEELLTSVFSKMGDAMASVIAPEIADMQQAGEGYLETLVRVTNALYLTNDQMDRLGFALYGLSIVGAKSADALINEFGSLDKMLAVSESYFDEYYSEQEKVDATTRQLGKAFSELGLAMPAATAAGKAQLRAQIEGEFARGEAGQKSAAQLMMLSGAFSELADASGQLLEDILSQRTDLQDQIDQLTMTSTQMREKERVAIDASNIALFDSITAIQNASAARQAADQALSNAKSATDAALQAVGRAIAAEKTRIGVIRDVAAANVSAITSVFDLLKAQVSQLYATVSSTSTMQSAQGNAFIDNALLDVKSTGYMPDAAELADAIAAARGGLSADQFATQFEADKAALVMAGKLSQLQTASGYQLTAAEQALKVANDQLTALDSQLEYAQKQVDALNGINTSVLSVTAAIAGLASAMAAQASAKAASTVSSGAGGGGGSMADAVAQGYVTSPIVGGSYSGIGDSGYNLVGDTLYFPGGGSHQVSSPGGAQILMDTYGLTQGSDGTLIRTRAMGGYTPPGLTWVGEEGPELVNFDRPSMIYTASQSRNIAGGNTERLERLVEGLTAQNQRLEERLEAIAENTRQLADQFDNVTEGGNMMRSEVTA